MRFGSGHLRSLGPMKWMQLTHHHQAAAAALGLIAIQVGIGVIMKSAQTNGSYTFSPSGSVSISEFLKLILASILFRRECQKRMARGVFPTIRGDTSRYLPLTSKNSTNIHEDESEVEQQETDASSNLESPGDESVVSTKLDLATFWRYFCCEVTRDKQISYYILAICYTLINNSIFLSYKLADPGTIQLIKSGGTLITALVMVISLNIAISKIQWIAICLQLFGLILTQYEPETGASYPLSTYFILLLQVFLSASSGVYNQYLLKSNESSLHADNMLLYAAGAFINLTCHATIFIISPDEPGFFQGYSNIRAILVVLSNVFIGLAITSVYKYADAVIKCFATAFATGILLYVSTLLFDTKLGSQVVPGTVIVFFASWLYMAYPAPKIDQGSIISGTNAKPSFGATLGAISMKHYRTFLSLLTILTIMAVAFLAMFKTTIPDLPHKHAETAPGAGPHVQDRTLSPFRDTLAMVRWNTARPERVPFVMKYQPFFDTVHISMPDQMPEHPPEFYNWTHDQYPGTFTVYAQVARMMEMMLANKPHVSGLMYFHFDAWLDPLAWNSKDLENMWFASSVPKHMCMNDTAAYDWWGWGNNNHHRVMAASRAVDQLALDYYVKTDEWCLGWSDIYYIPRRFFADFVLLSNIFARFEVFHENAIPTIAHIINNNRRSSPEQSLVDLIEDCWGSCCSSDPKISDVLTARCGHRLDYLAAPVVESFYKKLNNQAQLIDRPSVTINTTGP